MNRGPMKFTILAKATDTAKYTYVKPHTHIRIHTSTHTPTSTNTRTRENIQAHHTRTCAHIHAVICKNGGNGWFSRPSGCVTYSYYNIVLRCSFDFTVRLSYMCVGRGGALVESMTFNRRVVGSTPALAAT